MDCTKTEVEATNSKFDISSFIKSSLGQKIWFYLQLIVGTTIFTVIIFKANLSKILFYIANSSWKYITVAIFLNIVMLGVMALRLQLLAHSHCTKISYFKLFYAQFKAAFINSFVPGGIGGDTTRFLELNNSIQNKSSTFAVLAADRLVGLWAAILPIVALMFFYTGFLNIKQLIGNLVIFTIILLLITLPFLSNTFDQKLIIFVEQLVASVSHFSFIGKSIQQLKSLINAVKEIRETKNNLFISLCLSIGIRTIWTFSIYTLALSLHVKPPLLFLFGLIALVDIVRMLPVSPPNGLGVREAMLVYALGKVGISQETAIGLSFLIYGTMLINASVGALLFIYKKFKTLKTC